MDAPRAARRAFVALGSNLGDRLAYLQNAVNGFDDVDAVSDVYETKPVGGPEQGPYLNMVMRLETSASPRELLRQCRRSELEAGRVRVVRWGPRTLDADLLWIDGERVDEPDLVVPHPRMYERDFVLVPLADVGADLLSDDYDPSSCNGVVNIGPLFA
ncbi:MAG: 2-amino-4-hydroxy-6-hydroxymethyldihydropteridine diphosphokinase [Acidimicrobiaceae bacterium]|nr:2-amino-4-hydroxy-6-hydroxymethyldihydropteridine diphosphokinase [Acidimicrobiaceae bacterium]MDE0493827.1 2-amino-4-hydroxy-6-hydroxymethyldihydropteridine diphosphokinase [Acidimicrobiaceae bacterium]MDE0664187.1 2-amino-4-hydroxy-6-hydroxymethyldihydropteridine diphosphokinase [Acidimicrobiaceae bacterium]MXW89088.1 2-amino-4-hydroxy-6-hydroxymethyldihydropteridine diphosphokinase [Acidimicrobiaceae bacterium]MXY10543.1 2-amino-4-hydroxy-6-hydroxymethyldihydropteridine diphosphokinase [A